MFSTQKKHLRDNHLNFYMNNEHTYIEISESALNHNISFYKQHLKSSDALALVIKGNGYGHGLIEMGILSQKNQNINWLCVAHYQEAVCLRKNNVIKNILVLGYVAIHTLLPLYDNIYFMVDSLEYAHALNNFGKNIKKQIYVHIKIDTGLSRFGIPPKTLHSFFQQLSKLPYIKVTGIFSHFVASDSNEQLTLQQLLFFTQAVEPLVHSLTQKPYIHMSNTGSITSLSYAAFFNFFRLGLGTYGYGNNQNHLLPVLTWKTQIISIKTVPAHSYVSYACTYKTTRPTRIALLPIGYVDGYQLRFSNKTYVYVNNMQAPVIGRIGMNTTIIDISDCQACIGDEVVLLGPNDVTHASNLAKIADIHNIREILTGIHSSIKRTIIP